MTFQFWVYIVASHSGTLYIGITNDLQVRVQQHKADEIEGFSRNIGVPGLFTLNRLTMC